MSTPPSSVDIVEVAPRDGFQSVREFIPTQTKISVITALYGAGLRRMEATSFVSASAVPQLADAAEVLAAARAMERLDAQVLVPNLRNAERAIQAGAPHLAFVLSVSERHNMQNVRRTPAQSVEEYRQLAALLPPDTRLRLNVATAFDCPFEHRATDGQTMALLERVVPIAPSAEIALCDTTGRASPDRVQALFSAAVARFPGVRWAFHGHDTYGMGAANIFAAWQAGIRVFDASVAGLGGCPFAPGATGNVATEDVVWLFAQMGVQTGIDLNALVKVAHEVARIPDTQIGGRVRDALFSRISPSQVSPIPLHHT